MCMICFLTDSYHYKLRNSCQIQSDRYEHALLKYKEAFITNFAKLKNDINLCDRHKNEIELATKIRDEIEVKWIADIFDRLLDTYFYWINANPNKSLRLFTKLLEENYTFDFTRNISQLVFFRGRSTKDIISHWDMFHVPFNKRHKIGNQRYSLVGQPLLYLALTPIGVLSELHSSDFDNFKISTFHFKKATNKRVFDFTNNFYDYFKDCKSSLNKADSLIESPFSQQEINANQIKNEFSKLIISSACSFKMRDGLKDYSFCEEYVLPQLLAQILKERSFDGIIYSSTILDTDLVTVPTARTYKDNLALFTNYDKKNYFDETYVYDRTLYKQFEISNPLPLKQNTTISAEEIEDLFSESLYYCRNLFDTHESFIVLNLIESYFSLLELKIDNELYFETDAGKLHMLMLYNIILKIRNRFVCKKSLEGGNCNVKY